MPSPLPAFRHSRRAALSLLAVLVVAAAGASAAPAARAGKIADERAQARAVEARLNGLNAQVDAAEQAWDQARSQLRQVRTEIRRNRARLKIARHNLHVAQGQLSQLLVGTYKSSANVDALVLDAGSFSQLIDQIDFLRRSDAQQAEVLHEVQVSKHEVEVREAKLEKQQKASVRLVAKRQAEHAHAEALLAHENAVLANIKGSIKRLIHQRQVRAAQLARQRAAAAARAAARQQQQQSGGSSGGGGGPVTSSPPPPPGGSLGAQAVAIAEQELGVPYVWGGASPAGFDCSGLTMWVYAQLGVHLDHYTGAQWNEGVHVPPGDPLAPGDLVFFEPDIGHVGIYIGNGLFIHAPHTGTVVQISSLSDSWYRAEYQGAVRIVG